MGIKTSIDRLDIRLFLMFLLLFTFFIHWGGTNAWSRYDLTRSMVDDGSIEISNYSYNTMDKRTTTEFGEYINTTNYMDMSWEERSEYFAKAQERAFRNSSTQIYTDKAPVSSFLAIPGYIIGDYLSGGMGQQEELWIEKGVDSIAAKLSFETSLEQFMIVFTVSVLFGSILLVLMFKHLQSYVDQQTAVYATAVAGLATPLVYYTTSFFGVVNAAFFLFASYISFQKVLDAEGRIEWMYLAGILSALAISTEYYSAVVVVGFLLYLGVQDKIIQIPRFAVGLLVGAIPLLVYNMFASGNPFMPVSMLSSGFGPGPIGTVCSTYQVCFQENAVKLGLVVADPIRMVNTFVRLLFFETRGIFFYAPILLLSIPGTYELYKRDRRLVLLFPGAFLALIMLQASILNWLAGVSFGPRYAIVGLPFLILPVALGLRKMIDKGRIWKIIVVLVFSISLFNSFLGFNSLPGIEMSSEEYEERFNSFSAVQPEFYDGLIDKFERYGPRSEVLMSFTDRYKGFDVTYRSPYGPELIEIVDLGDRALLFSTNLVPLIAAAIIVLALLGTEYRELWYGGLIAIAVLFVVSFSTSTTYIPGEMHRGQDYSAAVHDFEAVFYLDEGEIPYMQIGDALPDREYMPLNTSINRNRSSSYEIDGSKSLYFPFKTHKGKNFVSLKSSGCSIPGLHSGTLDNRCISAKVDNISVIKTADISQSLLLQGWHSSGELSEGGSWMSSKGTIAIHSNESGFKLIDFSLSSTEHFDEDKISAGFNEKDLEPFEVSKNNFTRLVEMEKGWNKLVLDSKKCIVPAELENSSDNRCLSIYLDDLEILQENDVKEYKFSGFYGNKLDDRPWMGREGEIYFSSEEQGRIMKIELGEVPYLKENDISIRLNDESVEYIESEGPDKVIYLTEGVREGINKVELRSEDCGIPELQNPTSSDDRCLSYRLNNLSFTSSIVDSGWYDLREEKDGFRWMGSESSLLFTAEENTTNLEFNVEEYQYLSGSGLNISLNGQEVKNINLNRSREAYNNITLRMAPGVNSLRFNSVSGCERPAENEQGSSDDRCLSFRFDSLKLGDDLLWE